MCLYGIELLADNIAECRMNLLEIFAEYLDRDDSDDLLRAAAYVLSQNLIHADALKMRTPTRPVMDAEPGYEDAQDDIVNLDGGYLDDYEVRKALYWSLFARAHGHTYGCWPIWCMWRPCCRSSRAARGTRRCICQAPARCATRATCCSRARSLSASPTSR
jgi:hypothetical protein